MLRSSTLRYGRMNIEGILAVFTVALAAYAILPRWRQLDLQFRFRWFEWVVCTVGIATLIYLQFHPVFARIGWTPHFGLMTKWGVTTAMAASLVVLIVAAAVAIHMRTMALHPGRVPRFARLVEELLQAGEYAALFTLLERYLPRLWQIANGQNAFARARHWMMLGRDGFDHETGRVDYVRMIIKISEEREDSDEEVGRFRNFIAPKLGRLIPKQVHRQAAAQEVLRQLFTSDGFMRELVVSRPHLVVPLLKRRDQHYEFLDRFLRLSLRTPGSALYRELKTTEALEPQRNYRIEPQSRLVEALLGNATFAEEHHLWQPIAQEILAILKELRRADYDPYTESYDGWFREGGMWEMPLFITIRYFDVMVSAARAQGVRFDMWLRYMASFVERILENYSSPKRDYDPEAEFPTRYSWALYQIFDTTLDWASDLDQFPEDHPHRHPKSVKASQEVTNIPKMALFTAARGLRLLLVSSAVEPNVKQYIADAVFHRYMKFREQGHDDYAAILLDSLTSRKVYPNPDARYMEALRTALRAYDMSDRVMYEELDGAILGKVEA